MTILEQMENIKCRSAMPVEKLAHLQLFTRVFTQNNEANAARTPQHIHNVAHKMPHTHSIHIIYITNSHTCTQKYK